MERIVKFFLSDEAYRKNLKVLEALTAEQKAIAKKAGTDNPKFEAAWTKLFNLLSRNRFDLFRIDNRFDVRALSIALTANQKLRSAINIDRELLDDISVVIPNGSNLFIESLFQYFLTDLDAITNPDVIGDWLCKERKRKGLAKGMEEQVLCADGPTSAERSG